MDPPPLPFDPALAQELIDTRRHLDGALLPILQAIQGAFGCVPGEAVPLIAQALNLSRAEVHGVASFYADFRPHPHGRRVVRLCRAEACQAMGGEAVAQALLQRLGLGWGDTSPDGGITIEPVYCLGLCAVAPAALIDGDPRGGLDADAILAAVS